MAHTSGIGLYIHIPFCQVKCTYCDFNSYAGLEALFDDYATAVVQEMRQAGPAQVKSIYMGGGTPTMLPLSHLTRILHETHHAFDVNTDTEVSIEANPGTVTSTALNKLATHGVNRISLGVQSFDEPELRLLGRIHSASDAVRAVDSARQAGFGNINLDLLYGLPGQALSSWRTSLGRALDLGPDHLSLYALTVEQDTPLATAIAGGKLPDPDPDLAADMYELAQEFLHSAGFVHYEISNWARTPDLLCQHNLTYWRNEPYLGIGAGAHSWRDGRRWSNTASPADYVAQVLGGGRPVAAEETIHPALEMGETMITGLRLLDEGVTFERFRQRFDLDLQLEFDNALQDLMQLGLICTDRNRVRLSQRGRLLGNQVFLRFLPE
jgi:oxygen-independent coproporphyrinogen-3 oxidase